MAEFADALAFLSRLPVERWHASSSRSDAAFLGYAPMAGVVIAAGPCALLAIASSFGAPSLPVAVLTVAVAVGITGALHEDGLADVADGFGGGKSRDQKLSIMRDSRIGTYGAAALGCILLLRASCVSAVLDRDGAAHAAAVLVVAAASSRAAMLFPMVMLRPARTDGLARHVGTLPRSALLTASVLALAIAACASAWLPARALMLALVSGLAASLAMTRLARRQIGGMTGDVIGAAQQVAEIAVLLTLASA